jgi:hypothetical protein
MQRLTQWHKQYSQIRLCMLSIIYTTVYIMSSQLCKQYHHETNTVELWCGLHKWQGMIQTIAPPYLCTYMIQCI